MTFEYQLYCIPVDKPKSKTFVSLQDGDWLTYEDLLYIMNDPWSGDDKDGITFKIVRRNKHEPRLRFQKKGRKK